MDEKQHSCESFNSGLNENKKKKKKPTNVNFTFYREEISHSSATQTICDARAVAGAILERRVATYLFLGHLISFTLPHPLPRFVIICFFPASWEHARA